MSKLSNEEIIKWIDAQVENWDKITKQPYVNIIMQQYAQGHIQAYWNIKELIEVNNDDC